MKHGYAKALLFTLLFGCCALLARAQITLSPVDTTLCHGQTYTITGSFASSYAVDDQNDDYFSSQVIDIGFPFVFYGDTVSKFVISSNNFISFDLSLAGSYSDWFYPNALGLGQLDKVIMLPFQDVDFSTKNISPNPGVISYQSFGVAPHRKFVIEFCSVPLYGCSNLLVSNQLVLYEGSNVIEIYIKDKEICPTWPHIGQGAGVTYPGSAVEGLRGNGFESLVPGRDDYQAGWSASNDGRRFTPNGANDYTITAIPFNPVPILHHVDARDIEWYAAGSSTSVAKDSFITVTADNQVPYYVAKILGNTCYSNQLQVFSDTSWVHFNTQQTTIRDTICEGTTYTFLGKSLHNGGTYVDTLSTALGCDSVVTLMLTVHPTYQDTLTEDICSGASYQFNGHPYTTTGYYTSTFPSVTGCDSVVTLDLRVHLYKDTVTANICQGESYRLGGNNYSLSGFYTDTLSSAMGCDSIVSLNLTVHPAAYNTLTDSICEGSSYSFNGQSLTHTGVYTDTIQTVYGCDSIVTLNLTVKPIQHTSITDTICDGETYIFHGRNLRRAGVYIARLHAASGCDSVVTLTLVVMPSYHQTITKVICNGDSYRFNGRDYTATGVYTDAFQTVFGCDSLMTLDLTVQNYNDTIPVAICDGETYLFQGQNLSTEGFYTGTFPSSLGCDSVVTIDLTVHPLSDTTVADTICSNETYHFGHRQLDSPGVYVDTLTSSFGCDSVVTLNLSVNPAYEDTITAAICRGESYLFNGHYYTNSGFYTTHQQTIIGCDSFTTLDLTVNGYDDTVYAGICPGNVYFFNGRSYSAAGSYTDTFSSVEGCDSLVTLSLAVYPVYNDTLSESICNGETYWFNGRSLSATGVYTDTMTTVNGCDSVITIDLIVLPVYQTDIADTICSGDRYVFVDGRRLSASGNYVATIKSSQGCDSVINLALTVLPSLSTHLTAMICHGDTYRFDNKDLSVSGHYTATFQADAGCDSVVTLDLTVLEYKDTVHAGICSGSAYLFNGNSYVSTGYYTDTFQSTIGHCDSLITLDLTVFPAYHDTVAAGICEGESYLFNGRSLTTSGFYSDTIPSVSGCDSVMTLDLTVKPASHAIIADTICSGEGYFFGGQYLYLSGVYTDTLTASSGCDSIISLFLTANRSYKSGLFESICAGDSYLFNGRNIVTPGIYTDTFLTVSGCDSLVTLNLKVNPVYHDTVTTGICSGESYPFNGKNYTATGIYTDTLQAVTTCDSIVTLELTVHPVYDDTVTASICEGGTYFFNGKNYTATGFYTDTLSTVWHCDSLITLDLTVNPVYDDTVTASICPGTSYPFNGKNYTATGYYTDTLSAITHCDSVVTLHLTVEDYARAEIKAAICFGEVYPFAGRQLEASGTYADTLTGGSVGGCDSITTLLLTVNPVYHDTVTTGICSGESYPFNGKNYTATGVYTDTLQAVTTCDSIVTLDLTVHPVYDDTVTASICEGGTYIFNGKNYTATGFYTDTLSTVWHCDSLITLDLTVNPVYDDTVTASICPGTSYPFNGKNYTTTGYYTDTLSAITHCDSVVTLYLTVEDYARAEIKAAICFGETYPFAGRQLAVSGTYADTLTGGSVGGCDSITTLLLTVNPIYHDTITTGICSGESYPFNGKSYTATGVYTDTLQAVTTCDSIVTLALTVHPAYDDTVTASICEGDRYAFNGKNYTMTGFYTDTLSTIWHCDSLITLDLTVNPSYDDTTTASICPGENYTFNGNTYRLAGYYTDSFKTTLQCDSLTTLRLIVNPGYEDTVRSSICFGDVYMLNGQSYSSSGTYTDTLSTIMGCDSVVHLFLTVFPKPGDTVINKEGCNSLTFEGRQYTSNTLLQDTLRNRKGCDSLYRTIHITVWTPVERTRDSAGCDVVHFEGRDYHSDTVIDQHYVGSHGCDSFILYTNIHILHTAHDTLRADICNGDRYPFNGRSLSQTGSYTASYTASNGCDSFVVLYLAVHETPQVTISAETKPNGYCVGDKIVLTGHGAVAYQWWQDGNREEGTTGEEITVELKQRQTDFFVIGTDEWNCSDSDKIELNAAFCCDMFIPNAFTPNGDGLNDKFGVEMEGHPKSFLLEIYNRLGQRVFVGHHPQDHWDGVFNGRPGGMDTYYFRVVSVCQDGTKIERKGSVELLR